MGIWSSRHFFMNVLRCYSKTVVKKSDSFAVMVIFRWLGAVMNLSSCSMSVDAGMLRWVHAKWFSRALARVMHCWTSLQDHLQAYRSLRADGDQGPSQRSGHQGLAVSPAAAEQVHGWAKSPRFDPFRQIFGGKPCPARTQCRPLRFAGKCLEVSGG